MRALILIAFSIITFSGSLVAQEKYTISGVVTDALTGDPLPFADVFFANTFQGVNTNIQGQFELKVESKGVYQLVVRFVGYVTHTETIEVGDAPMEPLSISLKEEVTNLGSFTVVAKNEKQWKKYLAEFEEVFLGTSQNASKCEILNKYDLDFYFDSENNVLHAFADKPLRIKNDALGYYINYYLEDFLLDKKNKLSMNIGFNTFENMTSNSARKERVWSNNRDRAYYGSVWHFFSSLHQNRLEEEGFVVHHVPMIEGKGFMLNTKVISLGDYVISSPNDDTKKLAFDDYLRITYTREGEDDNYKKRQSNSRVVEINLSQTQVSLMTMMDGHLYIEFEENGFIHNPLSFLKEGYWAFEKVADMVPINYKPKQ